MINDVLQDADSRMHSTISVLEDDLAGMRTGRASTGLVEKLMVEYYGNPTPLFQLASISVPEPQTISIRPFDKGSISIIEKAIRESDIGLMPNSDGTNVRLNIPPLTQERRKDLVKRVSKRLEESRVSVRNIRRSAMDMLKDLEKEKMISEDEQRNAQDKVQELTDKYIEKVEEIGKRKEHEIMEI